MTITAERKQELVAKYRQSETDCGSPQVQVAIMTERISGLTEHLRSHKHDFASRRGLMMLVSKRTRLLRYLKNKNTSAYTELIASLGLRR